MDIIKPPRLRKGDLIGLVSPASTPQPSEKIEKAVRYLERQGYRVELGKHAANVHGYLAGPDRNRAEDFNRMVEAPAVKAIFALRGGYGSPRILPDINYRHLARNPKIVAGFSDITALQLAIMRKSRLVTFSSPMPAVEFWDNPDPFTEAEFWRMVTSPKPHLLRNPADQPPSPARSGVGEGRLLGGNLALVVSQLATPYMPSLAQSLLFLEEVDEYPYRVDRMFAQLRNANLLRDLSGLLLGQFTRCLPPDKEKPSLSIQEVITDAISWSRCPVLANFAYGHVPRKLTLPLGVRARLDANRGTIKLLEGAVS